MERRYRRRDADATRGKLLEAAERLFVERGFAGARVDEVARAAGVNKRMIYAYYGSKGQLYEEILRRAAGLLAAAPKPELPEDARAAAAALIRWYFHFLSEHPRLVRLLGWEDVDQGASQILAEVAQEALAALRGALEHGRATGAFRASLEVPKAIVSIHSLCHGYFARRSLLESLWGRPIDRAADDEMLDHIQGVVFDGICGREEARV